MLWDCDTRERIGVQAVVRLSLASLAFLVANAGKKAG